MDYRYGKVMPLEEAVTGYVEFLKQEGIGVGTEVIPVSKAYRRITAEACYAVIPSPHYNCSAMDGIAVHSRETFGATSTTPVFLPKGRFEVVDTGDPIPDGYDAVVMIEDVVWQEDGSVRLDSASAPWSHVRQVGEDICQGDMIIPSYSRISASHLGSLIAGGLHEVRVLKKVKAVILPTGDEIVPADKTPEKGEILEFNSLIFSAMLSDFDCEIDVEPILKDNLQNLTDKVHELSEKYDLVLINAGSSAGRDDYSSRAVETSGKLFAHGIAIRPGKPAIMGVVGNAAVMGLPGYPVSAAVVMENCVFPVVEYLQHSFAARPPKIEATLGRRIVSELKYQEYVRVKLGKVGGKFIAIPLSRGAGLISSLSHADGMLTLPLANEGMEAGDIVEIDLYKPLHQLENTLVINGSHDPIIDIIGDFLRKKDYQAFISSSHTGSMGGITAIMKGECMIAPIHLLDGATGVYNVAAVNKYLSDCDVSLVKGVKRQQGLFIPKGNPKNLKEIKDLTREDITFVNRQKGAGTRVLLDYLMEKNGITSDQICGYDNEMYTHTAVATQVACGNADCGLGVYSAAKLYDLDFIPLFSEEYDLVVRNDCMDDPLVKEFLEILHSDEFKEFVTEMGGYAF